MNPEEQGPSVVIKGSRASLAWVCSDEREVTLTQLRVKKGASREEYHLERGGRIGLLHKEGNQGQCF